MSKDSNRDVESEERFTENHESEVRNALIDRGLHLELLAYMALKRRGWLVRLHGPFWNLHMPEEETSWIQEIRRAWEGPPEVVYRTIDLVASRTAQLESPDVSSFQTKLVIECKRRSSENWVFYRENQDHEASKRIVRALVDELQKIGLPQVEIDSDHLSLQEFSSFKHLKYKDFRDFLESPVVRTVRGASHHSNRFLRRVAIAHTPVFGPSNIDNIRNACEQVLGACDFQDKVSEVFYMTNVESPGSIIHWRIYPVVIFSGPLWEADLDEEGKLLLRPLEWVTYFYSRKGKGYLVDVVGSEHLEAYLSVVEDELPTMVQKDNQAS